MRQIKAMMATLDRLGLPMGLEVVSGEQADDRLYVPMIDWVLACLERTGLLFVGDSKIECAGHPCASGGARAVLLDSAGSPRATAQQMPPQSVGEAWREGRD